MRLKIRNASLNGWQASVWIDGEQATDVTEVSLTLKADGITTATITRLVTDLDIETDADTPVDQVLHDGTGTVGC